MKSRKSKISEMLKVRMMSFLMRLALATETGVAPKYSALTFSFLNWEFRFSRLRSRSSISFVFCEVSLAPAFGVISTKRFFPF